MQMMMKLNMKFVFKKLENFLVKNNTANSPPLQGRPLFLLEKPWWRPNLGGLFLNIFPTVENF